MKVIISTQLEDHFNNFVVVDNFKRASELNGVDTVIIHKYAESDFDVGVFITAFFHKGVKRFVYINEQPSNVLKMALAGVGGFHFEDEFYFEDEEELLALLEGLDSDDGQQLALVAPSLNIISDFIGAFSRDEERIKAPIFLESVKNAVQDLATTTQQQQLQLSAMGESAIEVFDKASQLIRNMNTQNKLIEEKLHELENGMASSMPAKASFSNNILFFAPYTYRSNAKLLLIREYAPCRYLTSFVLAYIHHLHYELNRRPKLIFVVQKGAGVISKYKDYPVITQDNMNLGTLYNGEIVVTNNPKKDVMKELLSKSNDVYVVVDRLYGTVDIVSGRLTKVNAVGSRSDIARYNVKPEETIFPVTKQPKQFPTEPDARYAYYARGMGAAYDILDTKLGLKVGD